MATITKPMALDESFNTTESTPRSQADVLAAIESAIRQGFGRNAADVSYDNTTSGLTADDVQEAIDELAEEKVEKVSDKGLSTNDYTNEEKTLVATIPDKADSDDVEGTKTASGNPLTLTDAAPINAESLVVELEPKQEGSGDPSPTNIRPITGYTECEVDDVGKNLFDKSNVQNGALDSSGNVYLSPSDTRRVSDYIEIEPNTVYYLSNAIDLANGRTGFWYDENKTAISQITFPSTVQKSGAITSPNNAKYAIICVPSETLDIAQLEEGSTATPYEPYHSSNATIQFGQTVYGGRSNFTDGGTDKTNVEYTFTGNETYESASYGRVFVSSSDFNAFKNPAERQMPANMICEGFKVARDDQVESDSGQISFWVNRFGFCLTRTTESGDVNALKAVLVGMKVVIERATPTKISTPPTELKLLKGTNNITTNGTTITLGYQPDNVIGELKGMIQDLWDYVLAH